LTYEEYIITWGDGLTQKVNRSAGSTKHTYSSSGPYSVTVTGNYNPGGCGGSNTQLVTPINAIPTPFISSLQILSIDNTNGSIGINFIANSSFKYLIQQKATDESTFTTIGNTQNTSSTFSFTAANINTNQKTYIYKITATDNCGNSVSSDEVYSIKLSAQALSDQNQLSWDPYQGINFQEYTINRNSAPYQIINTKSTGTFTDPSVTCTLQYCYNLVLQVGTTNTTTITSNTVCINAISNTQPSALQNINSTISDNNRIQIDWQVSNLIAPISYYTLTKSVLTSNNVPVSQTNVEIRDTKNNVLDEGLNFENNQKYCYEVTYTNQCGNTSAKTGRTCPVILKASDIGNTRVILSWSSYENSNNQLDNYLLEKLDEAGNVYYSESTSLRPTYTDTQILDDRQTIKYRIKSVVNNTNNVFSYSNVIEVKQKFKIFFPNAFTPNGDGLNDRFEAKGLFIKNFKMNVYNKAGALIFTSNNLSDGWDGNENGSPATSDVYIYFADMEDSRGEKFSTKGTFTLIR
jgi:gliding motility-associated-like protein